LKYFIDMLYDMNVQHVIVGLLFNRNWVLPKRGLTVYQYNERVYDLNCELDKIRLNNNPTITCWTFISYSMSIKYFIALPTFSTEFCMFLTSLLPIWSTTTSIFYARKWNSTVMNEYSWRYAHALFHSLLAARENRRVKIIDQLSSN
jgi:hypothetical protein